MKSALEDIFMGQTASPSLSEGFRWEDSRRRVRAVNERVDAIYVDDELIPVPKTIWSE